jgi:hypothetical protein
MFSDLLPPLNAVHVTFKRQRANPGRDKLWRVSAAHLQRLAGFSESRRSTCSHHGGVASWR